MSWRRQLAKLGALFRQPKPVDDLEEEIRSHLEMEEQENLESGMPPDEAHYAALRRFGNVTLAQERSREMWGWNSAQTLWQDLRYGLRQLRKNPGFTAVAVLSLALGIGATTAVFSIVDTIFLRPLPHPEQNRLVAIYERRLDKPEPEGYDMVSMPTFLDWKKQSQSFEILTQSLGPGTFILSRPDRAEEIMARYVSEDYFRMLGAKACQGRLFLSEDFKAGQNHRGVLSFEAWQRLFGSNPSIVGTTILLDGNLRHVVGVMCPGFRDIGWSKVDLWMGANWAGVRESRESEVFGRLKPGISVEKAQAELDVIEARLAQQYPAEQKGYGARIQPLQVYLYGDYKKLFLAFFGAVGMLLLIACTNVANLVLARAATREKEMALRTSLGAGRRRLVRQLLTESLLLSAVGAGLGLLLAYGGVRLAVHLSPQFAIPRADEISVDVRILVFVVLVTCLTALLFGLFPALGASKPDLAESLKEGGRKRADNLGARRIQGGLVVAQIAFSLVLLMGAGLMIHDLWRILHAKVGFNTDNLTQMYVQLARYEYMEHLREGSPLLRMKPKRALTIQGIAERLKALPGVSAVSVTGSGVLWGCNTRPVSTEGPPRRDYEQGVCYEPVSPGYFRMLEIPVFKGRDFTEGDSASSLPVAIISQSIAQQYFPGQDPIGKMINIGIWPVDEFERRQVVGVVGDVRWNMRSPLHSAVYFPYSQLPAQARRQPAEEQMSITFLVRSATDPARLARSMERAVSEVAKDVVVDSTWTADYTRWNHAQRTRFFTWLLAVFAAAALVLAAVGVFGVMSYAVSRRTHEIGIRMALGAHPQDVLRLILRSGARLTLLGLAIGLGGAMALIRSLGGKLSWDVSLNEVKPTDPTTLVVVPLLLAVVALFACYIPAHRATKVDPMVALRYE
jgi:putative ABC transport system permease protein